MEKAERIEDRSDNHNTDSAVDDSASFEAWILEIALPNARNTPVKPIVTPRYGSSERDTRGKYVRRIESRTISGVEVASGRRAMVDMTVVSPKKAGILYSANSTWCRLIDIFEMR